MCALSRKRETMSTVLFQKQVGAIAIFGECHIFEGLRGGKTPNTPLSGCASASDLAIDNLRPLTGVEEIVHASSCQATGEGQYFSRPR